MKRTIIILKFIGEFLCYYAAVFTILNCVLYMAGAFYHLDLRITVLTPEERLIGAWFNIGFFLITFLAGLSTEADKKP